MNTHASSLKQVCAPMWSQSVVTNSPSSSPNLCQWQIVSNNSLSLSLSSRRVAKFGAIFGTPARRIPGTKQSAPRNELALGSSIITARLISAAVCPSNGCRIKRRIPCYSGRAATIEVGGRTGRGDSSKDWIAKGTRPCISGEVRVLATRRRREQWRGCRCFIPAGNYAGVLRVFDACSSAILPLHRCVANVSNKIWGIGVFFSVSFRTNTFIFFWSNWNGKNN